MEQCILILNIKSKVSPVPPAQYLTPENLEHLLSMPDTSTPKGRRHLVLLTVGIIAPYYPQGKRGRPPMGIEKMLRMYLLQIWFHLSDPATEDAI